MPGYFNFSRLGVEESPHQRNQYRLRDPIENLVIGRSDGHAERPQYLIALSNGTDHQHQPVTGAGQAVIVAPGQIEGIGHGTDLRHVGLEPGLHIGADGHRKSRRLESRNDLSQTRSSTPIQFAKGGWLLAARGNLEGIGFSFYPNKTNLIMSGQVKPKFPMKCANIAKGKLAIGPNMNAPAMPKGKASWTRHHT